MVTISQAKRIVNKLLHAFESTYLPRCCLGYGSRLDKLDRCNSYTMLLSNTCFDVVNDFFRDCFTIPNLSNHDKSNLIRRIRN
uniref:Uncharacterized protein n=1 Tax=Arundo donax TaxID=35708 RepID=A0A0A9BJR8_ARUDO